MRNFFQNGVQIIQTSFACNENDNSRYILFRLDKLFISLAFEKYLFYVWFEVYSRGTQLPMFSLADLATSESNSLSSNFEFSLFSSFHGKQQIQGLLCEASLERTIEKIEFKLAIEPVRDWAFFWERKIALTFSQAILDGF